MWKSEHYDDSLIPNSDGSIEKTEFTIAGLLFHLRKERKRTFFNRTLIAKCADAFRRVNC